MREVRNLLLGLSVAVGLPAAWLPCAVAQTERNSTASAADSRGVDQFGDPLPAGAVARLGTARWWAAGGQQECPLRFTPDHTALAVCDGSKVTFIDAKNGKELRRFQPAKGGVTRFAFAPDGKTMMTASWRSDVLRLWDLTSGRETRRIPFAHEASSIAYSPDGKTAAISGRNDIRLFDASTWQEQRVLEGDGSLSSLLFLPDGKTLIAGGGQARTIRWYDLVTGREIRRLDKMLEHSRVLVLSPDGKRLAAVARPGVLHLWDAASGADISQTVLVRAKEYCVAHLSFSPDSRTLVCGSRAAEFRAHRDSMVFFDAQTGREVRRWDDPVLGGAFAFTPDGKRLVQTEGVLRFRDVATGRALEQTPNPTESFLTVVFAPDGKTLLAGSRNGAFSGWDPYTGKQRAPLRKPPPEFAGHAEMLLGVALSGDGSKAALVDRKSTLHIWEPGSGKSICRIAEPPVGEDQASWSPDGKLLAVKHADDRIRIWDAATGQLRAALPEFGKHRFPHPHAFAPDGGTLATAPSSLDESAIRLWDTTGKETGKLVWNDNTSTSCLVFSADGKRLFAAHNVRGPLGAAVNPDNVGLRVWGIASGRVVRRIPVRADIRSIALSPDGKTIAVPVNDSVVLWELSSGKERGRFHGHRSWIGSVSFSPDGKLLAGSLGHTALVWDVTGISPGGKWPAPRLTDEEIERLWNELADADGVRAYRAMWRLAAAAERAVPWLAPRLRPVADADDRLARLVADLDSDQFKVRDRAFAELHKAGLSAEVAVRRALAQKPTLEMRRRLESLQAAMDKLAEAPENLRLLRALELLEHAKTAAAKRALRLVASGPPEASLTQEARACLQRLNGAANESRIEK
jgi:WD40 repeat protein